MDDGHTLPSEQRDFVAWHRGRPHYAVWALALCGAAIDARLERVRRALQPWLLPGYARQPHITLQLCGFVTDAARDAGEFGAAQLQAHAAALTRLKLPPFELHIGDAFSFASAACLAVDDPSQSLQRLRHALQQAAPHRDATPYVPHVTAGLYSGRWPLREVAQRLHVLTGLPPIRVEVRSLAWMCYETRHIGGPLRTLRVFDLRRASLDEVAPPA